VRVRQSPERQKFRSEFERLLKEYAGRPTALFHAARLTRELGGAKIYLKREDLLHTGAHKINNCIGQALLAIRMGKKRIIAEPARASTAWLRLLSAPVWPSMRCLYGNEDMRRQELNVFRMRLLGAGGARSGIGLAYAERCDQRSHA